MINSDNHYNRFGERDIRPSRNHKLYDVVKYEDELGMMRDEEIEDVDWSHDTRSESAHEGHHRILLGRRMTDERIKRSVLDLLGPKEISVVVEDGQVQLSGIVSSRMEKKEIEFLVETVPGIRDIENTITISRELDF